ncbi:MAG: DNRLRE domain-containing protein, partial [Anaerolineae bacterium]
MLTRTTAITVLLLAAVTALPVAGVTASLAALSGSELAQTVVTLSLVADAGIESGAPDTTFGHAGTLPVYYGGQNEIGRALIRFNLAASVPAEAIIDSARLDVFLQFSGGANPVNLVAGLVTQDWSESGVTWNNQPATGEPFLATLVDTSSGYKSLEVTDIVRAWHNVPHYGLMLQGPEGETLYDRTFESREGGEMPPRLAVTYHLPEAQPYTFTGHVYLGSPPDTSTPIGGVTVGLWGDDNEWPEDGRLFLTETATNGAGEFTLVWESGDIFPYYHIIEEDPPGTISTGAHAEPPGYVKNYNVVSYLDIPPGEYGGIGFWDQPEAEDTPTATSTRVTDTPTLSPTPTGTLPPDCTELLENGDFETGVLDPWAGFGDVRLGPGWNSPHGVWLGGTDNAGGELLQVVTIPPGANPVRLEFWWLAESEMEQHNDILQVIVQYGEEQADLLRTLRAVTPLGQWQQEGVDLTTYAGREVAVTFSVQTDGEVPSTFRLDDISLKACGVATTTPTPTPTRTATLPATATRTLTPSPTLQLSPSPTSSPTRTPTTTPTPSPTPGAICTLEDVSPGPGSTPQPVSWNASLWGKMLSLSITGVPGVIGPATSWTTLNGNVLVEGLAAADQNGKLIMFYWYPGSDWKAVNITEKTGRTIAVERPEYWLFTDTAGPFEKLAAPAPNGDLLVFAWRAETDWQATNLSSLTGKKITGPVTAWVTPFGSDHVEHLAARATNNDLLVFYRQTGGAWQVVNVTTLTGQKVGGPATSWTLEGGPEVIERLAAPAPNGDLLLFTYQPSTNWQVTNLSQITGQKVGGPATDWIAPSGPRAENLAAPATNGDLVIFYSDPIEGGWHVTNVTSITGQKVSGPATDWQTQSGSTWYEHLAAAGPNQHLYAFHKPTGGAWQVRDVTNITGKTITHPPTSWVTPNGPVLVEHLAAPNWDGRLYLFFWEPSHDWKTVNVSLKASGRTVYAAAEKAGVWRSRDYGINWEQLTRPQPAQGAQTIAGLDVPVVHDVAVSPTDPRLVLAATGNDNRNPSRSGIYRSTDGGATWTREHQFTCGNQVQPATQVIFAPDDPTTLYAAGGCAIGISTDSGATWTDVTLPGTAAWSRAWHVA